MAQILDKQGLQHYANKMCNADNRKVGTKSLPTVLNEIDIAIDGFKNAFEKEYGNPVDMEIANNQNIFSVGTGNNVDKKDDVENSFTDITLNGASLLNCIKENSFSNPSNFFESENNPVVNGGEITLVSKGNVNQTRFSLKPSQGIIKPNTKYTLVFDVLNNTLSGQMYLTYTNNGSVCVSHFPFQNSIDKKTTGRFKYVLTSANTNIEHINCLFRTMIWNDSVAGESITFKVRIFEGDWTNKKIPEYFEGLQSIGEKQNGNHKLNISSVGKNLFDIGLLKGSSILSNNPSSFTFQGWANQSMSNYDANMFKPNTTYTLRMKAKMIKKVGTVAVYSNKAGGQFYFYDSGMVQTGVWNCSTSQIRNVGDTTIIKTTFTTPSCINKYDFRLYSNRYAEGNIIQYDVIEFSEIQLEEASTNSDFELFKADKKEIVLNEPLRGLPNGVKDTIEKINGEWKIIRRCGEIILNGKEDWSLWSHYGNNFREDRSVVSFRTTLPLAVLNASTAVLCNNFITGGVTWDSNNDNNTNHTYYTKSKELIYCYYANATTKQSLGISIKNSKLGLNASNWTMNSAISNLKQWLSQHPTKVIYQLEMPIIEDIDPITLQCWKNGTISIIDEVLPVETTHTVALNKSAQIQKNIEELTSLRNRVQALEEQYNKTALNQAYETELLKLDMKLDNII